MFQLHRLFSKSLADKFDKSECLRVPTFHVKWDTLADFKKQDILKIPQGRLLQLIYK